MSDRYGSDDNRSPLQILKIPLLVLGLPFLCCGGCWTCVSFSGVRLPQRSEPAPASQLGSMTVTESKEFLCYNNVRVEFSDGGSVNLRDPEAIFRLAGWDDFADEYARDVLISSCMPPELSDAICSYNARAELFRQGGNLPQGRRTDSAPERCTNDTLAVQLLLSGDPLERAALIVAATRGGIDLAPYGIDSAVATSDVWAALTAVAESSDPSRMGWFRGTGSLGDPLTQSELADPTTTWTIAADALDAMHDNKHAAIARARAELLRGDGGSAESH